MNIALKKANQIIEFNEFEANLSEFKKKYENVIYDLSVPDESQQARSDRLAIGKVISKLDAKHKEIKAPLKVKTDLVDAERKRIKDDLLNVQGKIKDQIVEHERKIAEQEAEQQNLIDDIYILGLFDHKPCCSEISARLNRAESIDIDNAQYLPIKAQAALAVSEAIKSLNKLYGEYKKIEDEQEELDRLRSEKEELDRKDREDSIAKEAAENARLEAENKARAEVLASAQREASAKASLDLAEKNRIAAEKKAAQDAIDAKERQKKAVKDAKEKAILEASEKIAMAKRVEAAEDARRAADINHRSLINNLSLNDMLSIPGINVNLAKAIITAIAKNQIKNISIKY